MSDDFRKLIEDIEAEAKADGPAAEAELRELRREFAALTPVPRTPKDDILAASVTASIAACKIT